MRITKLELENLNSLKGKWSIDFTHADYAKNHDIFVICGATGAGKTTLLDAITLALYGRTPRLEVINNGESGNEIMTRGTGFCRAAVIYSCKRGVFVSEFQQNRAGMRSSGNLQKASFRIAKSDGEVVASGTASNLEKETQKIIQLDYKQFCRSILLAQGEFSAFLESSSRERAAILEKLTGTERYRKIAQQVAQKFSEIKKNFAVKKSEKEEIEKLVLSESDSVELHEKSAEIERNLSRIDEQLEKVSKELSFFAELERLQSDLDEAQAESEHISHDILQFAPFEEKLNRVQSAKSCETEYVSLKNLRSAQQSDENQLASALEKIKTLEEAFARAEETAHSAKKSLSDSEQLFSQHQIIWKKVRELDVNLSSAYKNKSDSERRKNAGEKEVSFAKERLLLLENQLALLQNETKSLSDYLFAHETDKNLGEAIAKVEALHENARSQHGIVSECDEKLRVVREERRELETELRTEEAELQGIEDEIASFVSADAVFITRMLQQQLADGKPCPVCGSVYHKNHKKSLQGELDLFGEDENDAEYAEKARKLSENSSHLTALRDEIDARIQTVRNSLERNDASLKNTEENRANAQNSFESQIAEINEILKKWQKCAKFENLEEILSELRKAQSDFAQKEAMLSQKENENSALLAEKESVSQNLVSLEKNAEKNRLEYEEYSRIVQNLREERTTLFGEKSADAEESRENEEIARLKKQVSESEQTWLSLKEEKNALEGQKTQLELSISSRKPELSRAERAFCSLILEKGFESEELFLSSCMSDADFADLTQKSESLRTRETQSKTRLSHAKKSFDDYKKTLRVSRTKEESEREKESLSNERAEASEKLIEMKSLLQTNAQNLARAEKIRAEFADLQEEFSTWEQMDKWVGKSDGSDVSVFVQSLAFNSLLSLTNKNLFGITGRYKIVQKNPLSLDFAVSDIYFEENRSVSNLSGGEKFLVSLSFALGISEFASRNVRVDSLFLDEGFGTLSGELLTEAINALKNLQKDGKMLGIITHVQDVIDEIDQRIEVKSVSGGRSVLEGAGIVQR